MARLVSGSGTLSGVATQVELDAFIGTTNIATVGTIATGTWEGTDVGVPHGGTGVSTLTDGGILLGSGTGAITATAVLADSEMLVGDGSTDPAIESGSTLRTSIGLGNVDNTADASQTSVGTITSGTWEGTDVAVAHGGTGASTHTANSVLVGAGTSAITSIAPGADGQVLTSTGTVWQSEAAAGGGAPNVPMFIADYDTANGTISATHDTYTAFANDRVVELDSSGSASTSMFSETNKRYTPDTAGYYYFVVQGAMDDVSDGAAVSSSLWKNGANVRDVEMRIGFSGGTKSCSCSSVEYMNGSSDYIEGRIKHNDGSTRTIVGGNYTLFAGYKLGT